MIDHKNIKLGKKAARTDPRTLKFAKYVTPGPPPITANWLNLSKWDMYGNDTLGDCVEAAAGHMINLWDSFTQTIKQPTTGDVIAAYSAVGGYVPGDPSTDNGTNMLDFLKYWRKTGIAGHKIAAFVQLKAGDLNELRQAVALFGAAYIGVQLPLSAQGLEFWSVPGGLTGDGSPGSWGGHCIPVGAYSETLPPSHRNTVITWGNKLTMSDYFYDCYCDEAYAVLSNEWLMTTGLAPSGFSFSQLEADLSWIV